MRFLSGCLLLIVLISILSLAGELGVFVEGLVHFDLDSKSVSFDWLGEVSWEGEFSELTFTAEGTNVDWDEYRVDGKLDFPLAPLTFTLDFDPASQSFESIETELSVSVSTTEFSLQLIGEPGALGVLVDVCDSESPWLDLLEIGWNLDEFGDLVQTASCALPFTYGRVGASFPWCTACEPVRAELTLTDSGFQDVLLNWGPVESFLPGVRFSGQLTYALDEKSLRMMPSLSLANEPCVTFFAGLDWDESTHSLNRFDIYGFDVRCLISDVQLRAILAFEPGKLSLVPAPYTLLLGAIWEIPSCCDERGKITVSAYFDEEESFLGLGRIMATFTLPLTPHLSIYGRIDNILGLSPFVTLAWEIEF